MCEKVVKTARQSHLWLVSPTPPQKKKLQIKLLTYALSPSMPGSDNKQIYGDAENDKRQELLSYKCRSDVIICICYSF